MYWRRSLTEIRNSCRRNAWFLKQNTRFFIVAVLNTICAHDVTIRTSTMQERQRRPVRCSDRQQQFLDAQGSKRSACICVRSLRNSSELQLLRDQATHAPVMVTSALPLLLRPGNLLILDRGFFLVPAAFASTQTSDWNYSVSSKKSQTKQKKPVPCCFDRKREKGSDNFQRQSCCRHHWNSTEICRK